MGWGQIIGGGGDGLYTVALDYGVATRDAWVAEIDGWIERMNIEIADAEAKLIAARDRTAAAEVELQALIGLLSSGGGPDGSAATMARIDIATAEYAKALAAQDALRIPRDQRIAERTALVAKKGAVQAAVVQEARQAWCVDFTEGVTGYVATIEVPGEDQAILIAPGARAPTAADGALAARELLTPEQVFFNAAILPGWQKWKPTYRKGTITWLDIDANLANVNLDAATSSANQLPINQTPQLNGVPMRYMECDATAFEVGDRVIVEFEGQDWQAPRVIGFVESPKPCSWVCVGAQSNEFFGEPDGPFGIDKHKPYYLECLIPGLVVDLIEGVGVEAFVRFDGGAKVEAPETGLGLNQYSIDNNDGASNSWIRFSIQFVPPTSDPVGIIESLPQGGLVFSTAHMAIGSNANTQSPGERWDIAEVILKLNGRVVLNFAVEELWDETHTRIAGVPIKIPEGRFFTASRLTDYTLAGG